MFYYINTRSSDPEHHSASLKALTLLAQRQADAQRNPVIITDDTGAVVDTIYPEAEGRTYDEDPLPKSDDPDPAKCLYTEENEHGHSEACMASTVPCVGWPAWRK